MRQIFFERSYFLDCTSVMGWVCLLLSAMLSSAFVSASPVDYRGLEALFGEPVTLSGTGKPQRLSNVPLSMTIITAEDIQKSDATDIPQLLRGVPGVDVTRNYIGQADVNIRGFNQPFSNRLLVLIDGRQVYMDSFGMTIWHALPIQLAEIQQIEIIRGPNTALFGFNAASGVVNIVTKCTDDEKLNQISGRVGSQSYREASLITTVSPTESWHVRTSLGGQFSDGYDRDGEVPPSDPDDAIGKASLNVKSEFWLTSHAHLSVDLGFNQQNTHSTMPYYLSADFNSISRHFGTHYNVESASAGLWHLRYYHNAVDAYIDTGPFLGSGRLSGSKNRLHVLKAGNLRALSPAQNLRFALEFRENSLTSDESGNVENEFTMDIFSANIMWDWWITPKLYWSNALNVAHWETARSGGVPLHTARIMFLPEDYNNRQEEVGFNVGLLYRANNLTNIQFSVSRGLRVPSLVELSRQQRSTFADLYGNPSIVSESLLSVDLGLKRKWGHTLKNRFEANIFYSTMDDVIGNIVYPPLIHGGTSNPAEITFDNVGDSDAYGLELALRGVLHGGDVNWGANYSYLRHKDQPFPGDLNFIDFAATLPKHKVNLHLDIRANDWVWDFNLHWVDARPNYQATTLDIFDIRRSERVDSYVLFQVAVSRWLTRKTRMALEGVNLLDEHFERPSFNFTQGAGGSNRLDQAFYFRLEHNF